MTGDGSLLVVFLDGVGIGEDDPTINPFVNARALVPTLQELTGGIPTLDSRTSSGTLGRAFPLDAQLGVDGTPQSGTGQVALLTGASAAEMHGRHFGPWTPVNLRPLVEKASFLKKGVDAALPTAFANAYPRGWPGPRGSRRVAGPPLAARGAGLLDRHEEDLGRGNAVSSEIVNTGWQRHLGHDWLPDITETDAGRNLAGIANRHRLTLYAHYATDTVGHRGSMNEAVEQICRVDRFLGGVLGHLHGDVTLLVVSDHGNIEDVRGGHTRNPVLGIASGPGAEEAARHMADLRDISGFVTKHIGLQPAPSGASPTPP